MKVRNNFSIYLKMIFFLIVLFLFNIFVKKSFAITYSGIIYEHQKDIILIRFDESLKGDEGKSPGFSIIWKKFDGNSGKNISLPLSSEKPFRLVNAGKTLMLKLSKDAPPDGLIIVKYNPSYGDLQKSDGTALKGFSCLVKNGIGLIDDLPEDIERHWAGRDFWANRLQDWRIRGGRLECVASGPRLENRTVHLVTREVSKEKGEIHISVRTGVIEPNNNTGWSGFLIGAGNGNLDYREAAMIQGSSAGGILCVMNMGGELCFKGGGDGENRNVYIDIEPSVRDIPSPTARNVWEDIQLDLDIIPATGKKYELHLSAWELVKGEYIGGITLRGRDESEVLGSIALVSSPTGKTSGPRFWFRDLRVSGSKIISRPERGIGPVISTMYSLSNRILKLTAQFMPLGFADSRSAVLEYRPAVSGYSHWIRGAESRIITPGYTAHFRIEEWDDTQDWDFRIVYGDEEDNYPPFTGLIRKDPKDKEEIVIAGFTGNRLLGRGGEGFGGTIRQWRNESIWFPHQEIVGNISKHGTDIMFFTGDQIYEGNPTRKEMVGRFPELDLLYKWYFFCWAFRDLMRSIPSVCFVDDHDVYQGNIWGNAGRRPYGRSQYGFSMDPIWVNMVQRVYASHNPDPYDPTPIFRGISTYYTGFNYGGVSFAVIEDRKFKSPPTIMGTEAKMYNGRVTNPELNIVETAGPDAKLLGDRQIKFLKMWGSDWTEAKMKICVSQTVFACVQTTPRGEIDVDTDSGGWPKIGRDKAIDVLRRAHAFKISGDQHLSFVVKHGIENYGDGFYEFCVPALANSYRRWFDPPFPGKNHKPGEPQYTGDFDDGFGNKITVLAVANPRVKQIDVLRDFQERTGRERDGHQISKRDFNCDGYGIVIANKKKQTFEIESWPWDADPAMGDRGQFSGWPITVTMADCDGRIPTGYLPDLTFEGLDDPVVQVIDEKTDEIVYTTRAKDGFYRPGVFKDGSYTIKVGEPGTTIGMRTLKNLKSFKIPGSKKMNVVF